MLFDGVCKLCTGSVGFVLRHEQHEALRFAPLQSPAGIRLMQEFGIDPAQTGTFVVVADGRAYVKSDAAIRVARFLRGGWKWLVVMKVFPRPIRDCAYDFVARNRYRWFGRHAACIGPTPELQRRFL